MVLYAIMLNPGHNRVYFEEAKKQCLNEFEIISKKLSAEISEIAVKPLAGVFYLFFFSGTRLEDSDLISVAKASFFYALFEMKEKALYPVEIPNFRYMDESLASMLKYAGKTNEIFTRMLLNLAFFSLPQPVKPLKVFDPLAGKGTTLFEGASLGYDVYGMEVGEKITLETYNFFRKYLEKAKYKHETAIERVSGPNKSFKAVKYLISYSKDKEEYKNKAVKQFEIVSCNSMYALQIFKKNFFDIIAGDLPYGVQHSSTTNENRSSFTRSPKELLLNCLPAWRGVLKPGGVMVLSWNAFVLDRSELLSLLSANDFTAFEGGVYDSFEHRVDQAIKRDVIIAVCSK